MKNTGNARRTGRHEETIKATIGKLFPLACPVAEYKWIDGWDFEMVYSECGAMEEHCIFRERLTGAFLFADPDLETTWIHVARLSQFFTPDLFLRLFYQTNSAIDRNNIQAVFVYRYKPPFGLVQLAYQRGTAEFGERSEQGNTLFLKATVVF